MRAKDVPAYKVDAAVEFLRKPLQEGFRAHQRLKDDDLVTMKLSELGHLCAWYAELQGQAKTNLQPKRGQLEADLTTPIKGYLG